MGGGYAPPRQLYPQLRNVGSTTRSAAWCQKRTLPQSYPVPSDSAPQTAGKAGRLRAKRVRGGPARARAISLAQRKIVSRAWRTTFATVLKSKKRSRLGLAV